MLLILFRGFSWLWWRELGQTWNMLHESYCNTLIMYFYAIELQTSFIKIVKKKKKKRGQWPSVIFVS